MTLKASAYNSQLIVKKQASNNRLMHQNRNMEATSSTSSSFSDIEIEAVNPVIDLITFCEIQDIYEPRSDVIATYRLGENVNSQRSDWIGIFRTGWKSLWHYHAFQWASQHPINCKYPAERVVVFPKSTFQEHTQPAKDNYQFLYVTKEDHVIGVSTPFKIGYRQKSKKEHHSKNDSEKENYLDDEDYNLDWLENALKETDPSASSLDNNKESLTTLLDNFEILQNDSTKSSSDTVVDDTRGRVVQEDHESLSQDFTYTTFLEKIAFVSSDAPSEDTKNTEKALVPYMPIYDVNKFQRPKTTPTAQCEEKQEELGYLLLMTPEIEYPERPAIEQAPSREVSLIPVKAVSKKYCPGCVVSQTIASEFMRRHAEAMDQVYAKDTEIIQLKTTLQSRDMDLKAARCTIQKQQLSTPADKEDNIKRKIYKVKEKRKTRRIISLKLDTHNMEQKIRYLENRLNVTEVEKEAVLKKLVDLNRRMEEKQKSYIVVQRQLSDVISILNDLGYQTSSRVEGGTVHTNDENSTMIENTRWKLKMRKQTEHIQEKLKGQGEIIKTMEEQLKRQQQQLDVYQTQFPVSPCSDFTEKKKSTQESSVELRQEQWPPMQCSQPRLRRRLEKCPTCGIRFNATTDLRLIEEHVAFHDLYEH